MAKHSEHAMLIAAVNAALVRAMDDGDAHNYNGLWLDQSPLEHIRHAYTHICELLNGEGDPDENLDHAICRLVMLKIVRDGIGGH